MSGGSSSSASAAPGAPLVFLDVHLHSLSTYSTHTSLARLLAAQHVACSALPRTRCTHALHPDLVALYPRLATWPSSKASPKPSSSKLEADDDGDVFMESTTTTGVVSPFARTSATETQCVCMTAFSALALAYAAVLLEHDVLVLFNSGGGRLGYDLHTPQTARKVKKRKASSSSPPSASPASPAPASPTAAAAQSWEVAPINVDMLGDELPESGLPADAAFQLAQCLASMQEVFPVAAEAFMAEDTLPLLPDWLLMACCDVALLARRPEMASFFLSQWFETAAQDHPLLVWSAHLKHAAAQVSMFEFDEAMLTLLSQLHTVPPQLLAKSGVDVYLAGSATPLALLTTASPQLLSPLEPDSPPSEPDATEPDGTRRSRRVRKKRKAESHEPAPSNEASPELGPCAYRLRLETLVFQSMRLLMTNYDLSGEPSKVLVLSQFAWPLFEGLATTVIDHLSGNSTKAPVPAQAFFQYIARSDIYELVLHLVGRQAAGFLEFDDPDGSGKDSARRTAARLASQQSRTRAVRKMYSTTIKAAPALILHRFIESEFAARAANAT